jgi:FkbM family methyltransferase
MILGKALRTIDRRYAGALRRYKIAKYSKLGPGHVFDITLDDMSFKMTFLGHKISPAIVERIEGRREPSTTAMMRALVIPGSRVLELGGCYGEFTIILSKCAGPDGHVVSIEGTPNNYEVLQKNIKLNCLSNVTAYKYFITSKAENVQFGATENHPYAAIERLKQDAKRSIPDSVVVPTIRLSKFLQEIEFSPDFIFMDIEGFEVDVFKDFAATRYLLLHRPVIVFETHEMFYEQEENLTFIKRILEENHYDHRQIVKNLVCFPGTIPFNATAKPGLPLENSGDGRCNRPLDETAGLLIQYPPQK